MELPDTYEVDIYNFSKYLTDRNSACNTVHVYTYALRQFFEKFQEVTTNNLQLYKLYLLEHYKPRTANLRIRAINCYLESQNLPFPRLTMVRLQQKVYLDHVISQGDYEYLKNCLVKDEKYLYYFLIRYMAATGMRVSEVTQTQVKDVRTGYKDLYAKGNKARRIYIPKKLQIDTIKWLDADSRHEGPIFLNRFREVISSGGIRGQLKKFSDRYGLNPDVIYPHSFRHRFAKNFIERGGDISFLSDLLGHESIETTRIYLRRTSSEQQDIVNRVIDW